MESNVPQLAKVPKHTRVSINRILYASHVVEQNVTRNQLMGQLFLLNFLKICRIRMKEIVTTLKNKTTKNTERILPISFHSRNSKKQN